MDFSIVIEENGKRDHASLIADKIAIAKKFGYRKVALNVKIGCSQINQIPKVPNLPSTLKEDHKFEIYTRLTVKLDDSSQLHKLTKSNAQLEYDLFSCEIGNNEKILNQFSSGQINCDILSFELTNPKLCFILRKANLNLPIEKGILFEINYRDLLASQSIRINTISNARLLIEKCKGKNILFSSGAKYKLDFRSPVDVSNLGELFDLKSHLSKEAVFWNAIRAIKHSSVRKIPISSVIDEDKQDTWLRKELNSLENKTIKKDEINLKRKDESLDQISKKTKIEI